MINGKRKYCISYRIFKICTLLTLNVHTNGGTLVCVTFCGLKRGGHLDPTSWVFFTLFKVRCGHSDPACAFTSFCVWGFGH